MNGVEKGVLKAVLIGLVLAVAVKADAVIIRSQNSEYEWFSQRYGPSRVSEHAEEWLVRDFFQDKRNGVFLDVGSSHYKTYSNTYDLEP